MTTINLNKSANNENNNTVTRLEYNTKREVKLGKGKLEVKIRLADDCNNGHRDFHITGNYYESRTGRGRRAWVCGGCCHDLISKYFPKFRTFIRLHGCDSKGVPTYAVENGFYHYQNSEKEVVLNYLRITEDEYIKLFEAEDKLYFKYQLYKLGIVARWEQEAKEATEQLETLTGCKFTDTSIKSQIEPMTEEEIYMIEKAIKEGFFLPENIEKRKKEEKIRVKNETILNLTRKFMKERTKLEHELKIKTFLLENDFSIKNFFYYAHSNEGYFNGNTSEKPFPIEEYDRLMALDHSELPEGLKFVYKTLK